jgi:hypothetical protein
VAFTGLKSNHTECQELFNQISKDEFFEEVKPENAMKTLLESQELCENQLYNIMSQEDLTDQISKLSKIQKKLWCQLEVQHT